MLYLLCCLLGQFSVSEGKLPQPSVMFKVTAGEAPTATPVESKPSPQGKVRGKVYIVTKKSCSPCKQAKAALAGKVLPFDPQEIEVGEESPEAVPRFYWDTSKGIQGFTGWWSVSHLVQQYELTTKPPANRTTQQTNNYTPHWTWPGELKQHLEQVHRISTVGMSQDDMEKAHDSHHDSGFRG